MEDQIETCKKCRHNPKDAGVCPCSCHRDFRGKQI